MSDLTDKLAELSKVFNESMDQIQNDQEAYWDSLTPEQQLDAFCCIVRRIHRGEVELQGSYRYVLYDVFGWGPEAYVPAQCAGYLDIHNLIFDGIEYQKKHRAGEIAAEVAAIQEALDKQNQENA